MCKNNEMTHHPTTCRPSLHLRRARALLIAAMLAFCALPAADALAASASEKSSRKSTAKKSTAKKKSAPKKQAAKKKGATRQSAASAPVRSAAAATGVFGLAERKHWDAALVGAKASGNSALMTLITWQYLLDPDSGASFHEITEFIRRKPDWPRQDRLRLRAEQSLRFSNTPDEEVKRWFEANPPVSGAGKIRLAEIALNEGAPENSGKVSELLREGWRDGDFDESEERRILASHGRALREEDHIRRADRLIWDEKFTAAARMLDYLPDGKRALVRARIALLNDAPDAPGALARVPQSLRSDPGLLYSRLMWRARREDDAGVREVLLAAPNPVPYPEKWWKIRERQVREAIDAENYSLARKLLANHGQTGGAALADAVWLSGWLSLEFLGNARDAHAQFSGMYNDVKFPVSRARAAYWAGRAAEKAGDRENARGWYAAAEAYPTTFYGQMAAGRLNAGKPLKFPAETTVSNEERRRFKNDEITRAIRLAAEAHAVDVATVLLHHQIDNAKGPGQAALAAELSSDVHSVMFGVRTAKRALQQNNVVLYQAGYPRLKLPSGLPVEPALVHAVTRQESEFDASARSRAGALGLMQLLPGTAKEVAQKADLSYSASRLYDPHYNIRLGSLYLNRLISGYEGSYVLAIASYNAGPGRVRQWVKQFGSPGSTPEEVINWIEKIPYVETRNYVQRVMENLQVYRQLLGSEENIILAYDLTRGN